MQVCCELPSAKGLASPSVYICLSVGLSVSSELWKEEIASKQKKIMRLDDMKLLSDQGIVTRRNNNGPSSTCTGISTVTGSFRRLEVD